MSINDNAIVAEQASAPDMGSLMQILWDQMAKIDSDETTPAKANSVNSLAGTLLRATKLSMEYAKAVGLPPQIAMMSPRDEPSE